MSASSYSSPSLSVYEDADANCDNNGHNTSDSYQHIIIEEKADNYALCNANLYHCTLRAVLDT